MSNRRENQKTVLVTLAKLLMVSIGSGSYILGWGDILPKLHFPMCAYILFFCFFWHCLFRIEGIPSDDCGETFGRLKESIMPGFYGGGLLLTVTLFVWVAFYAGALGYSAVKNHPSAPFPFSSVSISQLKPQHYYSPFTFERMPPRNTREAARLLSTQNEKHNRK